METIYYEINEERARISRDMWSFREYEMGSETKYYKEQVDIAYKLCEKVPEEYKEKALNLANDYAYKLAKHINEGFEIELICPSIMIAGGSNFPVKKKERQNSRRNNHSQEYEKIKDILKQIDNLETYKPRIEKQGKIQDIDFNNKFFEVVQNEELNRLQLTFDKIPSEEVRNILKSYGFKWSPKNQTWQRQLTNNAIYTLKKIILPKLEQIKG